jgi:RNA polymerase-binding transcription factor DksA
MNPGDPTGTFCDCLLPDQKLENGNLYCADCGRQIPEARDQLLVIVARSVRAIDRRLDDLTKAIAGRNGGGS